MARWHHPNHNIKSLQEPQHKTQKQAIFAHLHNTLSQCWGMDGHVLRSTSHEAILRIAAKHLTLHKLGNCGNHTIQDMRCHESPQRQNRTVLKHLETYDRHPTLMCTNIFDHVWNTLVKHAERQSAKKSCTKGPLPRIGPTKCQKCSSTRESTLSASTSSVSETATVRWTSIKL